MDVSARNDCPRIAHIAGSANFSGTCRTCTAFSRPHSRKSGVTASEQTRTMALSIFGNSESHILYNKEVMRGARSSIVRGFRADMHWIRCRYPDQTSADRCRRARQSVLPGALGQHRAGAAQWRARASLPPPARRDFRLLRRSTLQQRLLDSILTLRSRRHHQAPPAH